MNSSKDVHTEHCCYWHGCKYNDEKCTVVSGDLDQSGPCEECAPDNRTQILKGAASFSGWLMMNAQQDVIYEENLQYWICEYMKSDDYKNELEELK